MGIGSKAIAIVAGVVYLVKGIDDNWQGMGISACVN